MPDALTPPERTRLSELEGVIERGMQTFVEVGAAVSTIREGRLYRETHDTFEAYCQERWGWTASRARQLIGAAEVVQQVESVTTGNGPTTERQARELASVPEDERAEVWNEAREAAEAEGKPPTARHVKEAKERRREPDPHPPEPEPEDHEPDPIAEWERAEKEVSRLTDLVESMESDDKDRELRVMSSRVAGLEGRLHQAVASKNEAVRTAKYAQGMLRKIRAELGVETDREILDAIRDLKR